MTSKVILLNGCSSSGKTSIVKAIQHLSNDFWLTFGIDAMMEAMPDKYFGFGKKAAEGIQFVSSMDQSGFPITEVKVGPYGKKVSNSASKITKQLVEEGYNLIIDEVIWEKKDLENYASALKNYQVYYIKVNCELPIMEEREILRGDRTWGMARAQHAKMKNLNWSYDLEIDTSQMGPFANAEKILQFINSNQPQAFAKKY